MRQAATHFSLDTGGSEHQLSPSIDRPLSDLGNPKMAAFFTSLLPQFAPSPETGFMGLAMLGLTFSLMTLAWLAAYALAIARIGHWLDRSALRRTLEGVTGAALIGLGVKLATDKA